MMTDKERIYSAVIKALLLHRDEWKDSFLFTHKGEYTKGNILVAMTTFEPNEWSVGYYDHYDEEKQCVVIRDMVSGRLCNYYNETFFEIPTPWIGKYILLTGKKYKIYRKCEESLKGRWLRFHSLDFDDENKTFTFRLREPFKNFVSSQITMSTELPLKEIKQKLLYDDFEEVKN